MLGEMRRSVPTAEHINTLFNTHHNGFVQNEARQRFDKGMNPRDAAFDIPLGRYADWGDAERVVVTVRNLFDEFSGEHAEPDVLMLFEQMADFRDKLRAEGHDLHHHLHGR
jgi:hypothetical protein